MSFLSDFKAFAMRGNVIDMAVGVIIGGAFGKIVTSVVNDIIMPPIGLLVGGVNFTDLKWVMKPAELNEAGEEVVAAVTLNYGNFLQQHSTSSLSLSLSSCSSALSRRLLRRRKLKNLLPSLLPNPSPRTKRSCSPKFATC